MSTTPASSPYDAYRKQNIDAFLCSSEHKTTRSLRQPHLHFIHQNKESIDLKMSSDDDSTDLTKLIRESNEFYERRKKMRKVIEEEEEVR